LGIKQARRAPSRLPNPRPPYALSGLPNPRHGDLAIPLEQQRNLSLWSYSPILNI
jgi:hypothetical protein